MENESRKPFLDPKALEAIDRVVETVHRLRAPGGCPWDQKQTHHSLRPYLIEEAYEALEALDRVDSSDRLKDPAVRDPLREEFGDVLMQILLHSEMANEVGAFSFADVARTLDEKLIRRHPHVFGDVIVSSADEVVKNWDAIKKMEKAKAGGPSGVSGERAQASGTSAEKSGAAGTSGISNEPPKSVLDGIPKGLPALVRAEKTIDKVTKVGFQWPDIEGPLAKLEEEIRELSAAIRAGNTREIEEEIGDLLFSVCNVAFLSKTKPEDALRGFLAKFESRFRFVESSVLATGKKLEETGLEEMDRYWDEAKRKEKSAREGLK